jgi:hypothetical protein
MQRFNAYTNDFLDVKRSLGDPAADEFIRQQFSDPGLKAALHGWMQASAVNEQFVHLPEAYKSYDFMNNALTLPQWADRKLMKSGCNFFAAHAEAIMNLLGLLSLPYCYAAADGAMVLQMSGRMQQDTGTRLSETAAFIWDVMAPDAFEKQGRGFAGILNVRLYHAAARYYSVAGGNWNPEWGTAVNQEDMAGTNLSFSLIVVRGLRKLGYTIQYESQQGFMHLWNVIGYLLGLDEDLLPQNGKQAQLLESMIRTRHFRASTHGQSLTKALTDYLSDAAKEQSVTSLEVMGLMRYLLGDEVSGILNLSAPKLSTGKIQLLKLINVVSNLRPDRNTYTAFKAAQRKFKSVEEQRAGKAKAAGTLL